MYKNRKINWELIFINPHLIHNKINLKEVFFYFIVNFDHLSFNFLTIKLNFIVPNQVWI